MRSILQLNSFKLYNIFLLFLFSLIINSHKLPLSISKIFYCLFFFILVYLGIYYFRKSLYLIYFFYGLFLDIFLLDGLGPHLLVFIIYLFFINLYLKYLYNLSSVKVYFVILTSVLLMLFLQIFLTYFIFDMNIFFKNFIEVLIISIIFSLPIFLFFSKIDQFK